ncbi:MAG: NTP transferase domain-containing protein [Candidatus Thermoplasmatota archaeon]|nr:NTP transferase domain-containing protein [Candidatus Thermoplasmatota archaeon]MBS3789594.1 NTP transferase domain-containing protein [Candidatus Thermoplasmatota archaeon]
MKAVILAAGEGTRLRPFTATEPKVMIPVANKPILEYVVDAIRENGVRDIIMVVGYKRQKIMSYFGDGDDFGVNIDYVVQKNQPPTGGTAHALYQTKNKLDEEFILFPGDNVISEDTVSDLLNNMEDYTILITRSENPSKYGVVTLEKGGETVKGLVEKPERSPSHLISTGIYSFQPDVFEHIEDVMGEGHYDIPSVIEKIMKTNEIKAIKTKGDWIDAVYPWDLLHVNRAALKDINKKYNGLIGENVMIKGNVKIGKGTRIRGGSFIEGPTIIGEGCDIGPNVCIAPSSSIGDNTKIGPFTTVENSLVMNGAAIGSNSTIVNSVIGEGVKIKNNFSTYSEDRKIETEERLHIVEDIGAMIAEDTEIGSGVTIEAGVIVGDGCEIRSGRTIGEKIDSGSKAV